jgi:hypothetical protein
VWGPKLHFELDSLILCGLMVLSVFSCYFTMVVYAQDFGSIFYTPKDTPLGVPYGDWIKEYWDWWANYPMSQTPAEHKGRYQCFLNDIGNAIFLVDPLKMNVEETYSCNVPFGKPIFFSLVTSEYDTGVDGYEKATDKELLDSAKHDDDSNSFKLTVDGNIIPTEFIKSLRTESPFWNITIVPGNHYDSVPGIFRAVAEGFYIFLKPLSPGSHIVSYEASSPKPAPQVSAVGKITYNLFVNSSLP